MKHEWDTQKALRNELKHQFSFERCLRAFDEPTAWVEFDEYPDKERSQIVGQAGDLLLLVIYAERRVEMTRIISAQQREPALVV